jgi:hypothetical protein
MLVNDKFFGKKITDNLITFFCLAGFYGSLFGSILFSGFNLLIKR